MRRRETTGVLLVSIVALAKADGALIGVVAPALRAQFHLDNFRLGALASIGSATGALSALVAGGLVDRHRRALVVTVALIGWSLALAVAGMASGFVVLAVARLVSGSLSTVARPAAVSLVGDIYEPARRGRVMARLDAGQSVGVAGCYLLGAIATRLLDWRWAFWWLAAIGLVLALETSRLSEPTPSRSPGPPLLAVLRDLVRIRTNLVVLVSDAVGTFFYAGVTSFAVLFATYHYRLSPSVVDALAPLVGLGAVGGILAGGQFGDRLVLRSGANRRLLVASVCDLVAAGLLVPAIALRPPALSGILLLLAAAALGASGPSLDAARLDVVPPSIRGRAEASRGLLVLVSGTLGPVVFGLLATGLARAGNQGSGLGRAFLVMLVPLAASGLILLAGLGPYGGDAAAAAAGRLPRSSREPSSPPPAPEPR